MSLTTKDYLTALRTGNFFLFFKWLDYVACEQQKDHVFVGEDLFYLLSFEWLAHGFSEKDIHQIVLFGKLVEQEPPLFSVTGYIKYALTMVYGVLARCMLYQRYDMQSEILHFERVSAQGIIQFMKDKTRTIESFDQQLNVQADQLLQLRIEPAEMTKVLKSIKPLIDKHELCKDYLYKLQDARERDELIVARTNILIRLETYLSSQTVLSELILKEIQTYIKEIWKLNPQEWEIEYLDQFSPNPMLDRLSRISLRTLFSFFEWVEPQPTLSSSPTAKPGDKAFETKLN